MPGSVLDRMFDDESQFGEPLLDDEGNVFIERCRSGDVPRHPQLPAVWAVRRGRIDAYSIEVQGGCCGRLLRLERVGPGVSATRRRDRREVSRVLVQKLVESAAAYSTENIVAISGVGASIDAVREDIGALVQSTDQVAEHVYGLSSTFDRLTSEGRYSNEGPALRR